MMPRGSTLESRLLRVMINHCWRLRFPGQTFRHWNYTLSLLLTSTVSVKLNVNWCCGLTPPFIECGLYQSRRQSECLNVVILGPLQCFFFLLSEFHSRMTASVNQSVWFWQACRPCVGFLKPVAGSGGLVSGYKLAKHDRFGVKWWCCCCCRRRRRSVY